jgi:hypothetical protein
METYLPIIKTLLSDWLQLTLTYPWYTGALAAVVFLLTATLYGIRVASLKKKNIATEKARTEMQNNLNSAQQKMQLLQEELTANTGQMEKDKRLAQEEAERAEKLEEQLTRRNQQVAGIIQSLHTRFDLGERPLPVMGEIKAEDLWQQHERVINLITTRLQTEQQAKTELQQSYQAETVKRAEKEALLETLQTTLATQTGQLFKLEQALEEQKSILQQQQDKAQQVLSQTLEKHLTELAGLAEREQQALALVNTRQQLTQLEAKLNAKNALITQLEQNNPVDQVKVQAQPTFIKQEEIETIVESKETAEAAPPAQQLVIEQAQVSSVKDQTGGVTGKLKGLFGKTKQEPIAAEPESIKTRHYEEEIKPAPMTVEQPLVAGTMKDKYGRIKHYFGDAKPQSEKTKQDSAETHPISLEGEKPSATPAKGQLSKFKNLFGSKQKSEAAKQTEEAIQKVAVEVEQPSASPAKGQLGKLKNLFGKN